MVLRKFAIPMVAALAFAPVSYGQNRSDRVPYPSGDEVRRVVNEAYMAEFDYNPLISAQRILHRQGLSLRKPAGDMAQMLLKYAQELVPGLSPDALDARSREAIRYGKYGINHIDPGPIEDFAEEFRDFTTFNEVYAETYRRLDWMVDRQLSYFKSDEERNQAERDRIEESIRVAWEITEFRKERERIIDVRERYENSQ